MFGIEELKFRMEKQESNTDDLFDSINTLRNMLQEVCSHKIVKKCDAISNLQYKCIACNKWFIKEDVPETSKAKKTKIVYETIKKKVK